MCVGALLYIIIAIMVMCTVMQQWLNKSFIAVFSTCNIKFCPIIVCLDNKINMPTVAIMIDLSFRLLGCFKLQKLQKQNISQTFRSERPFNAFSMSSLEKENTISVKVGRNWLQISREDLHCKRWHRSETPATVWACRLGIFHWVCLTER